MLVTTDDIIAAARSWLDVPFHHQGRSRSGVDCAGFLIAVGHSVGIALPDEANYRRVPNAARLRSFLDTHLLPGTGRAAGEVGLFWTQRPQFAVHLGLFVDSDTLIHAWGAAKRVTQHSVDEYWSQRFVHSYRIPGVTY